MSSGVETVCCKSIADLTLSVPTVRTTPAPEPAAFGPTPQALAFQFAWQQHISPKLTQLFGRLAAEPEATNLALAQVRGWLHAIPCDPSQCARPRV